MTPTPSNARDESSVAAYDHSRCTRCASDTCPGRDDIIDCQVLIEGHGDARMEARSMLRRRYWTANRCPGCNVQESEMHEYGCPVLAVRRGW